MSLLMDALKRAEQEKKEAAKRIKHTGPNPIADTGEHHIHAGMENTGPHEMTVSQEMDLSLEPLDQQREVPESLQDNTDEYAVTENTSEMPVVDEEAVHEDADTSAEYESTENTQEMATELPPLMERGNGMSYDFDNTLEEEVDDPDYEDPFKDSDYAFDETLDSVTATQLAADLGGGPDQPTPVAAHTVFEASRGSGWKTGGRWLVIGVVSAAILVVAGVIIHYQTTPIARDIPRPVALPEEIRAQQAAIAALPKPHIPPADTESTEPMEGAIETSATAPTTEVITQTTAEDAGDATASEITAGIQAVPEGAELPGMDEIAGSAADAVDEESTLAADTMPMMEEEDSGVAPMEETGREATEPVVAMRAPEPESSEPAWREDVQEPDFEPIAPARPVTPEMIKISRSTSRDVRSNNNQQAYAAYQSGDLARAESLYKSTLAKSPDNRDALLGLAAIKLRQDDRPAAYLIYRKLLQINPTDAVAKLALLNMQGSNDPVQNESLLKLMLAERPTSHYLYFSLGTVYASQQKWADAQKAFFEAFALDNQNPDYALNLAVSLDRMGQSRSATEYYQKAVDLADKRAAGFTTSDVLTRIRALQQSQSS